MMLNDNFFTDVLTMAPPRNCNCSTTDGTPVTESTNHAVPSLDVPVDSPVAARATVPAVASVVDDLIHPSWPRVRMTIERNFHMGDGLDPTVSIHLCRLRRAMNFTEEMAAFEDMQENSQLFPSSAFVVHSVEQTVRHANAALHRANGQGPTVDDDITTNVASLSNVPSPQPTIALGAVPVSVAAVGSREDATAGPLTTLTHQLPRVRWTLDRNFIPGTGMDRTLLVHLERPHQAVNFVEEMAAFESPQGNAQLFPASHRVIWNLENTVDIANAALLRANGEGPEATLRFLSFRDDPASDREEENEDPNH